MIWWLDWSGGLQPSKEEAHMAVMRDDDWPAPLRRERSANR